MFHDVLPRKTPRNIQTGQTPQGFRRDAPCPRRSAPSAAGGLGQKPTLCVGHAGGHGGDQQVEVMMGCSLSFFFEKGRFSIGLEGA